MTERLPLRSSPEYIEAVVGIKPQADDRKDIRIRQIIRETFLKEPWAIEVFTRIREQQIDYLKDLAQNVGNPTYISETTQETLQNIGQELRATIEEGEDHLPMLHGQPVLATTNHLGAYKLAHINPQTELGADIPKYDGYNFMYPFLLYFASLSPVAQALGDELSYASIDYPGIFGQMHTEAGFIHIPPASQVADGRTELLKRQTAQLFQARPNTILVNFPEGGTGGKYNETGPYDLRTFKTGGYVIAAELGLPILTVAQYFDPHEGMRLKIFEPARLQPGTKADYQDFAAGAQADIQTWLTYKEQGGAH